MRDRPTAAQLGLYCATFILGAGVYTMPAEAARVGLAIPLVGLLVSWPLISRLYQRVVDQVQSSGSVLDGTLGAALEHIGGGTAGRVLGLAGQMTYVLPSAAAYIAFGTGALVALGPDGRSPGAFVAWALSAVLLFALERSLDSGPLVGRLLRQTAVWCAGISASAALPAVALPISILTFVAGVLVTTGRSDDPDTSATSSEGLLPSHRTSVAGLGLQVGLMAMLALALAVAIAFFGHELQGLNWLPQRLVWSDVLTTFGVLLFALVGTGQTCLGVYDRMADPDFRRRVVVWSLRMVLGLEITWLVVVTLTVPGDMLLALDAELLTSVSGVSEVVGMTGVPWLTSSVELMTQLALLIAVSSAASGFLEGLAQESRSMWIHRGHAGREAPAVHTLKHSYLALAALLAVGSMAVGLSGSALLRVAGIVGGGIIVLIVPVLAEPRVERRLKQATIAVALAAGLSLWGGWVALASTGDPGIVRGLATVVSVLPLPLAISVRRSIKTTVERQAIDADGRA